MTRKQVAREWLWLFGCFVAVAIYVAAVTVPRPYGSVDFDQMISGYWRISLGLYVVVQIIRGTGWAVRTVRRED